MCSTDFERKPKKQEEQIEGNLLFVRVEVAAERVIERTDERADLLIRGKN